jgi:hypothetical protein
MGSVITPEPGQIHQKLFNASYATMRSYHDLQYSGYEPDCYSVSFHDLNKVQRALIRPVCQKCESFLIHLVSPALLLIVQDGIPEAMFASLNDGGQLSMRLGQQVTGVESMTMLSDNNPFSVGTHFRHCEWG